MEPKGSSRGQKNLKMPDHTAASRSRPSTKLRDILMTDKPALSYADFHHQITKGTDGYLPNKSYGSMQIHGAEEKAKKDELVRYMSNLPSYLEKGKNFKEKPLNVGVLDWRRLEKWKYNNNQVPHKNSGYTSSASSTSYFSTEGSSPSSRDRSSSPAQQTLHRSSLQSHLEASPMKSNSQDEHYPGRVHSSSPARQRTYHLVPHHHQKVYPLEGSSHNVDPIQENVSKFQGVSAFVPDPRVRQKNLCAVDQTYRIKETGVSQEMHKKKEYDPNTNFEIAKLQSKGNSDAVSSRKGKLRIRESELTEAMQSRKPNHPDCSKERNTVVLLVPRDPARSKRLPDLSELSSSAIRMPNECGRKSSSEPASLKQVHGSDLSSNVPETCPLPLQEKNSKKKLETSKSRPISTLAVNVSSQQSPSRSRNIENKPSIVVLKSSTAARLSNEVDNKNGSQPTAQVRHPSPIRRLSSAMGNIIRSAGSRDNSPLRRPPSSDRAAGSVSLNTDKSQANSRARSSPLKRLLDPLIKPKAPNVCELAEPHRKDAVKVKSTIISATKGAKDSHQNLKRESTPVQALLKVAVKNERPILSFAVGNDRDNILAATVRECSAAEKPGSSWIYTFLSFHETKKKNALWPNHGTKGKGQFQPNVVAQMTVSDRQARTRQICTDGDETREFTLFSVDVGEVDYQNATELQPTNELAAIVVKPLKATQNSMSSTLILPGGVHTIPSKGSISTLTERWRSGGSCDCGGWDLGCQLRIFTSQGDSQKFLSSSKATNASNGFKLYHQVGQESKLALSFQPLKEGIYSVEFDSSISLLQTFATCVAILDCRGPQALVQSMLTKPQIYDLPRVSGLFSTSNEEDRPSSYVSYPPNSPVGRV